MSDEDEKNKKFCNPVKNYNLESELSEQQSSSSGSTTGQRSLCINPNGSEIRCKQCHIKYKDFYTAVNHSCMPFRCILCNTAFLYDYQLKMHKCADIDSDKTDTSESSTYVCSSCNSAFTESKLLSEHKIICSEKTLKNCHICDKKLSPKCVGALCENCKTKADKDDRYSLRHKNFFTCTSSSSLSEVSSSDGVANPSDTFDACNHFQNILKVFDDGTTSSDISDNVVLNLVMKKNKIDTPDKTSKKNKSKKEKVENRNIFSERCNSSSISDMLHIDIQKSLSSCAESKQEACSAGKVSNKDISKEADSACYSETESTDCTIPSDHISESANLAADYKNKLGGENRYSRRHKIRNESVSSPSFSENSLSCELGNTFKMHKTSAKCNEIDNMHANIDNVTVSSDINSDYSHDFVNLCIERKKVHVKDKDSLEKRDTLDVLENELHGTKAEPSKCITSHDISCSSVTESTNLTAKKKQMGSFCKHSRKINSRESKKEPYNIETKSSDCVISEDISSDSSSRSVNLASKKKEMKADGKHSQKKNFKLSTNVPPRADTECSDNSSSGEHIKHVSRKENFVSKNKNDSYKKSKNDLSGQMRLEKKGTDANNSNKSLEMDNSNQSIERDNSNETVEMDNSNQSVERDNSNKAIEMDNSNQSVERDNSNKAIEMDNSNESVEVDNCNKSLERDNSNKSIERDNSNKSVERDDSPNIAREGHKGNSLIVNPENKEKGTRKRLSSPNTSFVKETVSDAKDYTVKFKHKKFSRKQNLSVETSEIDLSSLPTGSQKQDSSEKRKRSITPDNSKNNADNFMRPPMKVTFCQDPCKDIYGKSKKQIFFSKITSEGTSQVGNSISTSKVLSSSANKNSIGTKKQKVVDTTSSSSRSRCSSEKIIERSKNAHEFNNSKSPANSVPDNRSSRPLPSNRDTDENQKKEKRDCSVSNSVTFECLFKALPTNGGIVIKVLTNGCSSFRCPKCSYLFRHIKKATEHSLLCQNPRFREKMLVSLSDIEFVCTSCYQHWSSASELYAHKKCCPVVSNSNEMFAANSNVSISDYIYHYENANKNHVCPKCSYSCLSFHTFNQHQCEKRLELMKTCVVAVEKLTEQDLAAYDNLSKFVCPSCQDIFFDNISFQNHSKMHINVGLNAAKSCVDSGKAYAKNEIKKIIKNNKDCGSISDVMKRVLEPVTEIFSSMDSDNNLFPDFNLDVAIPYEQQELFTEAAKHVLSGKNEDLQNFAKTLTDTFTIDELLADDNDSADCTSPNDNSSTTLKGFRCKCNKEINPEIETKPCLKCLNEYMLSQINVSTVDAQSSKDNTQAEHNENCATAEHSENCATAEHNENCATAEHNENCATAEHNENCATAERNGNCVTAERNENCVTAERNENCATAEHNENCVTAEHNENCATAEHNENCATAEHNENCATAEHNENCATAAQDNDSAAVASCSNSVTDNCDFSLSSVSQEIGFSVAANVSSDAETSGLHQMMSNNDTPEKHSLSNIIFANSGECSNPKSTQSDDCIKVLCYVPNVCCSNLNQDPFSGIKLLSDTRPIHSNHYKHFILNTKFILSVLKDIQLNSKSDKIILFVDIDSKNSENDQKSDSLFEMLLNISHPLILTPSLTLALDAEVPDFVHREKFDYKSNSDLPLDLCEQIQTSLILDDSQSKQSLSGPKCICHWEFEELMTLLLQQDEDFNVSFVVQPPFNVNVLVNWYFDTKTVYSVYVLKSSEQYACGDCLIELPVSSLLEHFTTVHKETVINILIS